MASIKLTTDSKYLRKKHFDFSGKFVFRQLYSKTALNNNFLLRFSATKVTSAEDFLNVANINELSDSTTIEQKKKKKSAVNTKNELKQHVSDYHLDSNGDKIKKDTIEPNDTLRTVIGDADQGYYNTGWFKNELLACWSYICYPIRIG